jgi:hypothetical protein
MNKTQIKMFEDQAAQMKLQIEMMLNAYSPEQYHRYRSRLAYLLALVFSAFLPNLTSADSEGYTLLPSLWLHQMRMHLDLTELSPAVAVYHLVDRLNGGEVPANTVTVSLYELKIVVTEANLQPDIKSALNEMIDRVEAQVLQEEG